MLALLTGARPRRSVARGRRGGLLAGQWRGRLRLAGVRLGRRGLLGLGGLRVGGRRLLGRRLRRLRDAGLDGGELGGLVVRAGRARGLVGARRRVGGGRRGCLGGGGLGGLRDRGADRGVGGRRGLRALLGLLGGGDVGGHVDIVPTRRVRCAPEDAAP